MNRHFYRYGGHIEFDRFKEHYGMPRRHEHIPIYSLRINARLFLKVFLEKDCNGKKDLCAVLSLDVIMIALFPRNI